MHFNNVDSSNGTFAGGIVQTLTIEEQNELLQKIIKRHD